LVNARRLLIRYTQVSMMLACLFMASFSLQAAPRQVAIILDDLGDDYPRDVRALQLPGAITYAILPHTSYSLVLAQQAHVAGKEVMLHMPMSTISGRYPGPGSLTERMDYKQFLDTLKTNLQAIPFIKGLNNHMGSGLTKNPQAMQWFMQALSQTQLYFVDSRTTPDSIAEDMALAMGIPSLGRDVFLDRDRSQTAIRSQFDLLIRIATLHGQGVAIGHPYPSTLAVLDQQLPRLERLGIQLVPVSALLTPPPPTIAHSQDNTRSTR